jgi:WD40 repeat protein
MQVIPPLQVIEAHKGGVWSICVAPSGLIVTAGGDGLIKSWRLEASSGELLPLAQAVTPHTEVLLVRQSSRGVLLSVGHEGGLAAWELNPDSGQLAQRQQPVLPDDRQHYNDRLLETASGHLVAWAYGTVGYPAVCRWSELARTFVFLQDLPIERASVFLELPDGDLLSGDEMGRICRWRLEKSSGAWNKAGALQAHEGPVHALAWTREHALISAGGNEPLLRVWRADGGEGWVLEKPLRGHQSSILEVLEADSAELLSADRGQRSPLGWRQEPEVLVWSKGPEGLHLSQRQTGRLRGCVDGVLILENEKASALSLWSRKQEHYKCIAVLDRKRRGGVSTLPPLTKGLLIAGGLDGSLTCWDLRPLLQLRSERTTP